MNETNLTLSWNYWVDSLLCDTLCSYYHIVIVSEDFYYVRHIERNENQKSNDSWTAAWWSTWRTEKICVANRKLPMVNVCTCRVPNFNELACLSWSWSRDTCERIAHIIPTDTNQFNLRQLTISLRLMEFSFNIWLHQFEALWAQCST